MAEIFITDECSGAPTDSASLETLLSAAGATSRRGICGTCGWCGMNTADGKRLQLQQTLIAETDLRMVSNGMKERLSRRG
jgi:hypothetical protein